jgi:hypothetical protein
LCSQSTISRLENLPDVRALLRLGRALIEQYSRSPQGGLARAYAEVAGTQAAIVGKPRASTTSRLPDLRGFR